MSWSWPRNRDSDRTYAVKRSQAGSRLARFGPFQLDTVTQELWKDGKLVPLQSQPFRILALLASNPNELVTREAIRRELWREETSLGFDNSINASVAKLRSALADSVRAPRYVETLARRGYRFIAPVEWDGSDQAGTWPEPALGLVRKIKSAAKTKLLQLMMTSLVLGLIVTTLAGRAHPVS